MTIEKQKVANVLAVLTFFIFLGIFLYAEGSNRNTLEFSPVLPMNNSLPILETTPSMTSFPPEEILGIPLMDHESGADVIAELKIMHGGSEKVEIEDAHRLKYETREGRSIIIWIGITNRESGGEELSALMTSRIKSSPRFYLREDRVGNFTVYNLRGLGFEENYYYGAGNKILWIGTNNIQNMNATNLIEDFAKTL